jgi:class 3 adenylate cyclase
LRRLRTEDLLDFSEVDNTVHEIRVLADRLRVQYGGLDDEAILAVSEATGVPADYVRLAVRDVPAERRQTFMERVRSSFLAFDPDVRRYTMAGVLATGFGLFAAIAGAIQDSSGFMMTLAMVLAAGGLWNAAVSRLPRVGLGAGALFGGVGFVFMTFFRFVFIAVGAFAGLVGQRLLDVNRKKLGIRDPASERRELLEQLQNIQEKLKSDERFVTFLSVDVVGSTRLKAEADPLTAEFTFNEYHRYVQAVAERHGGRVHSTAGDGVTCVFEDPQQAFSAGRALLAGLFEFNAFRNKLSRPMELRGGVHTGNVHAPGADLVQVNFAHVIDVAAHLQKAVEPGALAVSEETARYLPGGFTAVGEDRVQVEGLEAAVWKPRAKIALPEAAALANGLEP